MTYSIVVIDASTCHNTYVNPMLLL